MKSFADGAPLRLVLRWEPQVTYSDLQMWESVLANDVDTPEVREVLGHFNRYEIAGDEIAFFMHTSKRRIEVSRLMRTDKDWKRFKHKYPEARVEWAEDVESKS